MNPVYVALVVVSLLAAGFLAWALWEDQARRAWKSHDATLERRVAVDEALLAELRGPRQGADVNDPWRAV